MHTLQNIKLMCMMLQNDATLNISILLITARVTSYFSLFAISLVLRRASIKSIDICFVWVMLSTRSLR